MGVGPATTARLREHGVVTVGQLAGLGEAALVAVAGRATGRRLHALAHNLDPRPVRAGPRRRSYGSQSALGRGRRSWAALDAVAVALVDRVTRRMRAGGRRGRTIVLRVRFDDLTRATRSRTLGRPTATTAVVLATVRELLVAERPVLERRGVTLLGVTVTNLRSAEAGQLELPFDVDAAVDAVRDRFGAGALSRAALLRAGPGLAPWRSQDEAADGGAPYLGA